MKRKQLLFHSGERNVFLYYLSFEKVVALHLKKNKLRCSMPSLVEFLLCSSGERDKNGKTLQMYDWH